LTLRDCADVSLIAIGFPPSLFDLWGQCSFDMHPKS